MLSERWYEIHFYIIIRCNYLYYKTLISKLSYYVLYNIHCHINVIITYIHHVVTILTKINLTKYYIHLCKYKPEYILFDININKNKNKTIYDICEMTSDIKIILIKIV